MAAGGCARRGRLRGLGRHRTGRGPHAPRAAPSRPVPLSKDINFKTLATGTVPPEPGRFTACSGIVNTASGAVHHTTVDIAFSLFISAPGARPGDTCRVETAVVEGESEEPSGFTATGTFTTLIDKSVVRLCVVVTRPQAVAVSAAPVPAVCPPVTTSGVPQGAVATTFPGTTTPGPRVGTFVGPTIVFPGPTSPGVPPAAAAPAPARGGGLFGVFGG